MNESEAKLFLLDLGTGAQTRSESVEETVTEMQEMCNITEETASEIRPELLNNLDRDIFGPKLPVSLYD